MHRKQDLKGNLIGQWNFNPLLNTMVYTTEFPNEEAIEVAVNTATESIFHHCDADGNKFMLFNSIMDHKSAEKPVKKSYDYITRNNQAPECRKMTKGWEFLIDLTNGMTTWEILSYLK